MARFNKLKRPNKHEARVNRPVVVTSKFDLHYEDIIRQNRTALIIFAASGLLAFAALVPSAVYRSAADRRQIVIKVTDGTIINPQNVIVVKNDSAGASYVQFGQ